MSMFWILEPVNMFVTLLMKDVIKLRILRRINYPVLSTWAHCNPKGYIERGRRVREGDMTTEAEVREERRSMLHCWLWS